MYPSIFSGFLLLVAIIIIIIFAYYATIIIGKKTNKLLDNRYTKIIERASLGLNTNITILKINEKIYILAFQGKTMKLLDIINEVDWKYMDKKNDLLFDGKNITNNFLVKKLFNKRKDNSSEKRDSWNGSDNDE